MDGCRCVDPPPSTSRHRGCSGRTNLCCSAGSIASRSLASTASWSRATGCSDRSSSSVAAPPAPGRPHAERRCSPSNRGMTRWRRPSTQTKQTYGASSARPATADSGQVDDRRLAGVLLDRVDAVQRSSLRLVALAGRDDLAVAGLQVEAELAVRRALDLELRWHGISVASAALLAEAALPSSNGR